MASEPARARLLWAVLSLVFFVTLGFTTACRSPALAFSATINFAMKRSTPCSAVLRHFLSSWAAVVHWSALTPKALRSSSKHLFHLFFCPPPSPRSTTNFPNITHFGSLGFSICATNPANKIHLLCKVALMLSLPVLIRNTRILLFTSVLHETEMAKFGRNALSFLTTMPASVNRTPDQDIDHDAFVRVEVERCRKSGGRCNCYFTNRCSESGSCGGLGAAYRRGTGAGST